MFAVVVYKQIKLTIAQAFVAENSYLLSKMRISLTLQKWTEFEHLPYTSSQIFSTNGFLIGIT